MMETATKEFFAKLEGKLILDMYNHRESGGIAEVCGANNTIVTFNNAALLNKKGLNILNDDRKLKSNTFDVVYRLGGITPATQEYLKEISRITKIGGHFLWESGMFIIGNTTFGGYDTNTSSGRCWFEQPNAAGDIIESTEFADLLSGSGYALNRTLGTNGILLKKVGENKNRAVFREKIVRKGTHGDYSSARALASG